MVQRFAIQLKGPTAWPTDPKVVLMKMNPNQVSTRCDQTHWLTDLDNLIEVRLKRKDRKHYKWRTQLGYNPILPLKDGNRPITRPLAEREKPWKSNDARSAAACLPAWLVC